MQVITFLERSMMPPSNKPNLFTLGLAVQAQAQAQAAQALMPSSPSEPLDPQVVRDAIAHALAPLKCALLTNAVGFASAQAATALGMNAQETGYAIGMLEMIGKLHLAPDDEPLEPHSQSPQALTRGALEQARSSADEIAHKFGDLAFAARTVIVKSAPDLLPNMDPALVIQCAQAFCDAILRACPEELISVARSRLDTLSLEHEVAGPSEQADALRL
jgi:hypothetical protein